MQLGMVGLGRMGANIVRRLMRDGHECVVYDVGPEAVAHQAANDVRAHPPQSDHSELHLATSVCRFDSA